MTDSYGVTTQEASAERTSVLNQRVVRRIKLEQATRDWHQSDLARHLGVGEKWISRRMRLELALSLDELESIAAIFGLGAADLLDPNGPRVSLIAASGRSPDGALTVTREYLRQDQVTEIDSLQGVVFHLNCRSAVNALQPVAA